MDKIRKVWSTIVTIMSWMVPLTCAVYLIIHYDH